ncbi:hypothetical protein CPB83DRAFT_760293 [Crepidotus variabilis]|uniref:NAD-dependent epimerase/dehydratase domain-containing protein n=1 Tax=Crepidotus variabilis TaxID=179855 RepID=A0A9P6JTP5_9AGAR|nr:hypothetical protein CPB83DRAFT_760293 [Crepidotus variabilis]
MSLPKVVVCGAGFLGKYIAKEIAASTTSRSIQVSSRQPQHIHEILSGEGIAKDRLLLPITIDVTNRDTLRLAFENASVVVSLVGVMHGSPQDFDNIQWRGAENVAIVAKEVGAKVIHFSAIGADPQSHIPYVRTKGLGEKAVLDVCPDATIIRPSLVFGPGDDFFNRFARLTKYMPFLPVFGGGKSLFQPVFVGDIARLVEIASRRDSQISEDLDGKVVEAGGPKIYSYRELMELVLRSTGRWRPILSLPFSFGKVQGAILERLPTNIFTVTKSQVDQLQLDNIVASRADMPLNHLSLEDVITKYSKTPLHKVEEVLPTYLQ